MSTDAQSDLASTVVSAHKKIDIVEQKKKNEIDSIDEISKEIEETRKRNVNSKIGSAKSLSGKLKEGRISK